MSPAIPSSKHFRVYLQQELIRRCEKNSAYSLRAFAKALGLHHATLSRLLAGKRSVSHKLISRLSSSLGLSPTDVRAFTANLSKNSDSVFDELTHDTFVSISEWYYDAILELTHIRSFQGDARWIAKVLGITQSEVNAAVERLQRLELLKITSKGKWLDLSRNNTTNITNDLSSAALRKLQSKILALSQNALEELPRTARDHTSMTVAANSKDLAHAKEMIKQFRIELVRFLQREKAIPDSVFQLSISFFPLTRFEDKKNERLN